MAGGPFRKLKNDGLGEYLRTKSALSEETIAVLVENGFNGPAFLELTEEDMIGLGLKLGARKSIKVVIRGFLFI